MINPLFGNFSGFLALTIVKLSGIDIVTLISCQLATSPNKGLKQSSMFATQSLNNYSHNQTKNALPLVLFYCSYNLLHMIQGLIMDESPELTHSSLTN